MTPAAAYERSTAALRCGVPLAVLLEECHARGRADLVDEVRAAADLDDWITDDSDGRDFDEPEPAPEVEDEACPHCGSGGHTARGCGEASRGR